MPKPLIALLEHCLRLHVHMYMYAHYAQPHVPTQKPYWVGHTVYTVHAITVISILFLQCS